MEPSKLVDQTFGPKPLTVTTTSVADFVEVTDDDANRWSKVAPPGFAAAALFAVAPDLLGQIEDRSVLHGEQRFLWHAPIEIGATLAVIGRVARARERGGAHFVGFDMEAEAEAGKVVSGTSLFVVSGETVPGSADFERPEPQHSYRGAVEPGQVSASRDDLIRYAAATRDWNPIHWDHDAAAAAGLPGVIVHGLLQSAWACKAVADRLEGERPLRRARARFHNPLLPARPVDVTVDGQAPAFGVSISDETATYMTATVEALDE